MPPNRRDLKQLIRETLLADSALTTLVGQKVYGAHKVDADEGSFGTPSIIVELETGNALYSGAFQSQFFSLWTYSRVSLDEASQVYDLAFVALQGIRMSNTDIAMSGICDEVSRPDDGWNEKIRSHYVRGRWAAHVSSDPV